MRVLFLLLALGLPVDDMVVPKVEHHERHYTQSYDEVTITCPDGYEGHWVDQEEGFDARSALVMGYTLGTGEQKFTICFKKEFMEQVRKNPELLRAVPVLRPN